MALLAFSLLIIGHEFGHFIMARVNGVKVLEFSLGMGPKLFSVKGKETEYLIKALPIGGYVRMYGEEDDVNVVDDRAFSNKTSFQKLTIVAAGPIMNFIIAILLFSVVGGFQGHSTNIIESIVADSPAMESGLQPGDKITEANGKMVTTWEDFLGEVIVEEGKPLNMQVDRNGEKLEFRLTPELNEEEGRYMVGIYSKVKEPNFIESVSYGINQTGSTIRQTFGFFGQLFRGKVSSDDVGGPISIIKISGRAAQQGILTLLNIMALFSVQLAIFNVIPFPALDGGWIFLLLFQIITGKEVDKEKVATINYYGFLALMGLMVFVLIKDIINPIQF
ncbi:RIP metalloprotease RseP [Clostridium sp.]|uniref:RIP metalloprotease RseP n=1 Tax=Clostridium sp. TaxID=1506 RepID=UPI003217B194